MSNFMGVGIFWISLNRADLGCWRLTLSYYLCLLVYCYPTNSKRSDCFLTLMGLDVKENVTTTTTDNSAPVLTHVNLSELSEPDDQYQIS